MDPLSMCRTYRGSSLAFCVLFSVLPLWGQSTAEVRGRVLDPSHHPAISVFVMITAQDTSLMRAATTDDTGQFEFPSLPVDSYNLEIKADGYPPFTAKDVRASIGRVIRLDIILGERPVTRAAVSGNPLVETENTQLGVVMGEVEVTQLPLKSHDAFELLQLQPGVQSMLGADLFFGGDQPGVVSVSGGRARSNNYNINGGTSGDQMVNFPSIEPSPDSISEFRVLAHNYDASSGRNSGSVLNVITKSGAGSFHGSLYEFFRNNVVNAAGFFDSTTPDFKQNQFGGTFGGPVHRDRTFFFVSYEGRREIQGITSDQVIVPTAEERTGDFYAGPTFAGILRSSTVAEALSNRSGCAAAVAANGGAAIAAGAAYSSIFPNNAIPSQCFDATATDLMNQFVPQADAAGNTYIAIFNARARNDQGTFRLDHNLTGQQQFNAYYYVADSYDNEPFDRFLASGANLPGFGNLTRQRFQQVNLAHLWTITAKTVNELRAVYYRNGQKDLLSPTRTNLVQDSCSTVPADQCFADPSNSSLGITPGIGAHYEGVPFVSLSGSFSFGNNSSGNFAQTGNIYQALDTYSRVAGDHTLKFGVDWRDQRLSQLYFYDVNGSFSFYGGGPNDVGFTSLIPNYLLGLPDSFLEGSANAVDVRSTQFDLFAQDSWRLNPNLVLTYGLRWEWNTPQADAGKRVQTFRPGEATGIYPCVLSASDPLAANFGSTDCSPTGPARSVFPLGLVVPGDPGVPEGLTSNYLRSFAPRLGLAWSPDWSAGRLSPLSRRAWTLEHPSGLGNVLRQQ